MVELHMKGMTCAHCVARMTKTAGEVDSQSAVQVELASKTARAESGASVAHFTVALPEAGYPA